MKVFKLKKYRACRYDNYASIIVYNPTKDAVCCQLYRANDMNDCMALFEMPATEFKALIRLILDYTDKHIIGISTEHITYIAAQITMAAILKTNYIQDMDI